MACADEAPVTYASLGFNYRGLGYQVDKMETNKIVEHLERVEAALNDMANAMEGRPHMVGPYALLMVSEYVGDLREELEAEKLTIRVE